MLMQAPVAPLSFLRAKIIGAMRTIDGTVDDKIIAVAADDPGFNHINELSELPEHRWTEIRSFFESYKNGEDFEQPVRNLPMGAGCQLAYRQEGAPAAAPYNGVALQTRVSTIAQVPFSHHR